MDGLLPFGVAVDDQIEGGSRLRHQRDKLLSAAIGIIGVVIVHQRQVALRGQGTRGFVRDGDNILLHDFRQNRLFHRSTNDHDSFYPQNPGDNQTSATPLKYAFTGSVIDLSCMYEINFFPYGFYQDFFGHKRLTPFLQLGAGMAYASKGKGVAFNIPMGCGIKYRVSRRVNMSLDWAMHFSLSDKLDGVEDPLGIKSSGFKNKDHFGITMLTVTYSFAPRCQNCNKD